MYSYHPHIVGGDSKWLKFIESGEEVEFASGVSSSKQHENGILFSLVDGSLGFLDTKKKQIMLHNSKVCSIDSYSNETSNFNNTAIVTGCWGNSAILLKRLLNSASIKING